MAVLGDGCSESALCHTAKKMLAFARSVHIMEECVRTGVLSAVESELFSPWPRRPRRGSKSLEILPLFEERQSGTILIANDLWTKEEEWEGSLWDIWKGWRKEGWIRQIRQEGKYSAPK